MIAIVDYGVGNLFSLSNSFAAIGEEAFVSSDPGMIQSADKIVLPGVGAFSDAADKLRESGLDKLVLEETKKGKKLLGICLGMQLLFEESFEYGRHRGLGLLEGQIKAISDFASASYKIPHMGWNALTLTSPKHELFKYINEGDCA